MQKQLYYIDANSVISEKDSDNWDGIGYVEQIDDIANDIISGKIPNVFELISVGHSSTKLRHISIIDGDDEDWWYPNIYVKQVVQTLFIDDNEFLI